MFDRGGDSGNSCLILDIKRNAFHVSPSRMISAVAFCSYLVLE